MLKILVSHHTCLPDMYLLRENGGNPEILSKIEKIDTVSEEGENICGISEHINEIYIAGDKNKLCRGFSMREYIEERAVEIANYIIENNATVRQTAKQFRISKSTVHKDVTERLLQINPSLAHETRKVLRSEERRVGKECRIGCRSRWSPYH